MTTEELSLDNAHLNSDRMFSDVKNNNRILHPPRINPPLFSRGHATTTEDTPYHTPPHASARIVESEVLQKPDVEITNDILELLSTLRGSINDHTTDKQRAVIRESTHHPTQNIVSRSLYTNPRETLVVSIILSMIAGALLCDIIRNHVASTGMQTRKPLCTQSVNNMLRYI